MSRYTSRNTTASWALPAEENEKKHIQFIKNRNIFGYTSEKTLFEAHLPSLNNRRGVIISSFLGNSNMFNRS